MKHVRNGQTVRQDPEDKRVYWLDWDEDNLGEEVELTGAGTITIEPDGDATSPVLAHDSLALRDDHRSVNVRIYGGSLGARYRVSHKITTNESPAQTKEKSFFVVVEDL